MPFELQDIHIGYIAGITTSMLWVGTSLFFTAAGHRIGPTVVNTIRIILAIFFLASTHKILTGLWLPVISNKQMILLAFSGIIGLSIGDQALFSSFIYIGPRLATLIMATSPIFAVALGWIFLDESLSLITLLGISITIAGVAGTIMERPTLSILNNKPDINSKNNKSPKFQTQTQHRIRGFILAFIGAMCQAAGLLLSKQGMGHGWMPDQSQHLDPQAATLVRMIFAGVGVAPIILFHYMRSAKKRNINNKTQLGESTVSKYLYWKSGLIFTACGAFVGPFLGVWLSLVACDKAPLGIAQTLISLSPILILPFAVIISKEKLSIRAILGAFTAVAGLAIIFWQPVS